MLIMLFNLFGYQFAISMMQQTASCQLDLKLDRTEYEEAELIEITVPLNMPYQERFTEFERHYGEINIDGKAYTYVKRKIAGDLLILKCIPNRSKEKLNAVKDDMAKANSNAAMDHQGKNPVQKTFAKNMIDEFDHFIQMPQTPVSRLINNPAFSNHILYIPSGRHNRLLQPPKAC
jgi:hypothetical protein